MLRITWRSISEVTYKNSWIGSLRGLVRKNRIAEMNRTSHHYFSNGKFRLSKSRALASKKRVKKRPLTFIIDPAQIFFSPYENEILDREMISYWHKINKPVWEINAAFDLPLPCSCDCTSCSACKTSPSFIIDIICLCLSCLTFSPPPFLLFLRIYESYPSSYLPLSLVKPTQKRLKLQFIDWSLEAGCKRESIP